MTHSAFDVAIVGAGPAGAWAATCLARAGAAVTLFDPSHPREKPCGGGVTGRALQVVQMAFPHPVPRVAVESATFGAAQTPPVRIPLRQPGSDSPLIVTSRRLFDGALLDAAVAAGAALVSERVVDVSAGPERARVVTARQEYNCSFVIGADGATSLVRRRLGRAFRREQLALATGYFARGVTSTDIRIEFVEDPPGYLWSFPRPDHLAIGICAPADRASAGPLRQRALEWLTRSGLAPEARLESYSWPIPSLRAADLDHDLVGGPRWLLTGDAAGLVDPLTREGIFFALESGAAAATALTGARDPARWYAERVADELHAELRLAARLQDGFFRPAFVRLLLGALRQSEPVRTIMADLIAGRQPYRGLRRRLLGTLEWSLALRWLQARTIG